MVDFIRCPKCRSVSVRYDAGRGVYACMCCQYTF